MRIISQDGLYDFPYETSVLRICDCNDEKRYRIVANTNCIDCYWNFGFYSSKAKAEKAMLDLIEFYTDSDIHNRAFQFPADEDVKV